MKDIKIKVNCSNCAYGKKKMGGIVCNNSQSSNYNRIVNYSDTCDLNTGRENDGFITRFEEE